MAIDRNIDHHRKAGSPVTDIDTPAADSGDAGDQAQWQAKYNGLMRLANERGDAATKAAERAAALEAELSTYKAREAETLEEQREQAEYERLRERFEEEPPPAQRHLHEARGGGGDDGSADYILRKLRAS